MPSFEIQADIFTRLSVFDSPKGSSNTFKTHKNISLYFKRRHLIIYNYACKILMKTQAIITMVILSILQTSLDQFRVFKAGSILPFSDPFCRFAYIIRYLSQDFLLALKILRLKIETSPFVITVFGKSWKFSHSNGPECCS